MGVYVCVCECVCVCERERERARERERERERESQKAPKLVWQSTYISLFGRVGMYVCMCERCVCVCVRVTQIQHIPFSVGGRIKGGGGRRQIGGGVDSGVADISGSDTLKRQLSIVM